MDDDPSDKAAQEARHYKYRRLARHASFIGIPLLALVVLVKRWPPTPPTTPPSWTDVILALATIAYVLVTYYQLRALRESTRIAIDGLNQTREAATAQLEETRRANVLTLRAWVFVDGIEIEGGVLHDDAIIAITVRNYGKLPAIRFAAFHRFHEQPNTVFPEVPDGDIRESGWRVIAAGQDHTIRLGLDSVREHIGEIANHRLILWLTLRLRYTDDLGSVGNEPYRWFYSVEKRFRQTPSDDAR